MVDLEGYDEWLRNEIYYYDDLAKVVDKMMEDLYEEAKNV